MKTAAMALGLLAVLAQPLRAVALPSCPEQVERSAIARRLCREVSPSHRRVLMKDSEIGFCSCRCSELEQMTFGQVMDMRTAGDSSNAANLRRFAGLPEPVTFNSTGSPYLLHLGEDTIPMGVLSHLCAYDRMLVKTIKAISDQNVVDLDGFTLELMSQRQNDQFYPVISPGIPGGAVDGTLNVPRRFVADPAVRWELMLFMLLHELGHGVNYEQQGVFVSEYEADMWAVNVGLPRFLDDGDGQEEGELERALAVRMGAADQLRKYFISVHSEEALPYSIALNTNAIGYPAGMYPVLECRLDSIRGGILREEPQGDAYLGYPSTCWAEPQASLPQRNNLPIYKECEPNPELMDPCEKYPGSCELRAEVDTLMQEWNKLLDKCAQRPDLCFKEGKVTEFSQFTAKGRMSNVDLQRQQLLKDIRRARATVVRTGRELQGGKK